MKQKRIVTIQDLSCIGKCSLGVALPVISALGVENAVLPTAVLSTHTGEFKNYSFCDLTDEIPKISKHWEQEKFEFDAIYVGYLGSVWQMRLVEEFIDKFRGEDTVVFIDPVMADNGELYAGFDKDYVKEMRKLLRCADIICPNLTEACFLTDTPYSDIQDRGYIEEVIEKLSALCQNVVLTGVGYDEHTCGAVSSENGKTTEVFRKKTQGHFYGTGDLFASAFIGEYVISKDFEKALNLAADFVTKSIELTLDEKEKYWYGLKFEQALSILINKGEN